MKGERNTSRAVLDHQQREKVAWTLLHWNQNVLAVLNVNEDGPKVYRFCGHFVANYHASVRTACKDSLLLTVE